MTRQVYHLTPDQVRPLIDAPDQDALNAEWQRLGIAIGFVWTTVADLQIDTPPIGQISATFTAESETPQPDPAFEAWFAAHFPDWRNADSIDPSGRVIRSMTSAAFEAGRRIAAETLGGLASTPASDDQIDRLRDFYAQECPPGVPNDGQSIAQIKAALADIDQARAAGLTQFIVWAEPIITEVERRDHDIPSAMAMGAAILVLAKFASSCAHEVHAALGTQSASDLEGDGHA